MTFIEESDAPQSAGMIAGFSVLCLVSVLCMVYAIHLGRSRLHYRSFFSGEAHGVAVRSTGARFSRFRSMQSGFYFRCRWPSWRWKMVPLPQCKCDSQHFLQQPSHPAPPPIPSSSGKIYDSYIRNGGKDLDSVYFIKAVFVLQTLVVPALLVTIFELTYLTMKRRYVCVSVC